MVLSLSDRLLRERPPPQASGMERPHLPASSDDVIARVHSRRTDISDAEMPDVGFELGSDVEVAMPHAHTPFRADVSISILSEISELDTRLSARVDAQMVRLQALENAASAAEDTAGAADRLGFQMTALHTAVQDLVREKPTQVLPPIVQLREELRTEFNYRFEDLRAAVDKRLTGMRSSLDSIVQQPAPSPPLTPLPPCEAPSKDVDALEGMRAELNGRHTDLRTEVDERLSTLSAKLENVARRPSAAQRSSPATERVAPPPREQLITSGWPAREQSMMSNARSSSAFPGSASASVNVSREFSRRSGSCGGSSDSYHPLSSALSFSEFRHRDLTPKQRKAASMEMPSGPGEMSAAGFDFAGASFRAQRSLSPGMADFPASSCSSQHTTPKRSGGGAGTDWEDLQVMGEGRQRIRPVCSWR